MPNHWFNPSIEDPGVQWHQKMFYKILQEKDTNLTHQSYGYAMGSYSVYMADEQTQQLVWEWNLLLTTTQWIIMSSLAVEMPGTTFYP